MAVQTKTGHKKRSKQKQQADFLAAFCIYVSVLTACKKSKVARSNVYEWLKAEEKFNELYQEAARIGTAALEDEAVRRAHEGMLKPIYQGGKLVGKVREYSDTLLIVLLKARAPEKYKDRFSGEMSGPGGKPLLNDTTITHVHSNVPLSESEDDIK